MRDGDNVLKPVPRASLLLQLAGVYITQLGDRGVPGLPSMGRRSPLLCHWPTGVKGKFHPSALGQRYGQVDDATGLADPRFPVRTLLYRD